MNLELLEKIFQNLEMTLTQKEAEEKAILFMNTALGHLDTDMVSDNFEDYWLQISREWDLNVYDGSIFAGDDLWHICLYPIENKGTNTDIWVDVTEKFYNNKGKN